MKLVSGRKGRERWEMLSTLDPAAKAAFLAKEKLEVALWMIPTAIVLTALVSLSWWWAQETHASESPVPRRFAFGDTYPWYAVGPANLYVLWRLARSWFAWRKVRRDDVGEPDAPEVPGTRGPGGR